MPDALRYPIGFNMIDGMIERFQNHLWFWRKVDMRAEDECWPWLASTTANGGYGNVRVPRKLYYFKNPQIASRVAYYIAHFNDPFPLMENDRDGLGEPWDVHHDCENPICCNPLHLRLIPHSENVQLGWDESLKINERSYPNFILAYPHLFPRVIEKNEHWDWRNNI